MLSTPVLGGRYRLVDRLGEGGMSVVWRGYDEVLDRSVAVKVLAASGTAQAPSRTRILAEARAAARLSHPHVSQVYDYGESRLESGDHVPYIVMELLAGQTLGARLRQGPLPAPVAVRVCAQVASALAAAHRQGLVHRDVKPGNIMLTADGPKVVDFGIAAAAGEPAESGPEGDVWGTPAYVAPERLTEGRVVPASDVYGLGLVLYRALTGEPPWQTDTVTQLLDAHKHLPPAPLPPIDGLPAPVAALCHRCLAKQPEQRPTAEEVSRTLAAVGAAGPGSADGDLLAVPPEPPTAIGATEIGDAGPAGVVAPAAGADQSRLPRRRRIALAVASAAVLFAGVLGGFWLLGDRSGPEHGLGGTATAPGGSPASPQVSPTVPDPATSGQPGVPGGNPPPATPPGAVDHVVDTPLGTVVVRCDGDTASLVSSELLPGASLGQDVPDPGPELSIEVTALQRQVEVAVHCQDGEPVAAVDVS